MDKHRHALELVRRGRARIDGVVLMTDQPQPTGYLVTERRPVRTTFQKTRPSISDEDMNEFEISTELVYSADTIADLQAKIDALERLRPHWAMGFTSDSIAAQTTISALNQIWSMLGVDNQTAAMDRLRQLTGAERT
jgi:hypothetical protein